MSASEVGRLLLVSGIILISLGGLACILFKNEWGLALLFPGAGLALVGVIWLGVLFTGCPTNTQRLYFYRGPSSTSQSFCVQNDKIQDYLPR